MENKNKSHVLQWRSTRCSERIHNKLRDEGCVAISMWGSFTALLVSLFISLMIMQVKSKRAWSTSEWMIETYFISISTIPEKANIKLHFFHYFTSTLYQQRTQE